MAKADYVKAFAVAMVRDGKTPSEAVKMAEQAWAERQAAEQAVEQEMNK